MKWYVFVTVCLFLDHGETRLSVDTLVNTRIGRIRGLRASDGDYSMFLGIPYAKVNESNPFGTSLPYPKFEETFNAFNDSARCPQIEEFGKTNTGTLDCLHLHIYVPDSASSKNKLPVMVYFYGGKFAYGFASRFIYGPKYLVRHDVLLVILNYRLGPYGFMCLDRPEVPGNQGLKDQLSALKWVKDNIDAFGGDAEQITIFGESAGATSVDFHLMSDQKAMFKKAILQSGSAAAPWAIVRADTSAHVRMSEHLGFKTNDASQALSFLAGIDSHLVIAAASELSIDFSPCVEKHFDGVERMISVYPINAKFEKSKFIPILSGYNNDEMVVYHNSEGSEYNNTVKNFFKNELKCAFDFGDNLEKMVSYVRHFYIGDAKESEALKRQLIDFHNDITFCHPMIRSLEKYLENDAKVYYCVFSYDGNRNYLKRRYGVHEGGAGHADDLGYLFDISYEVEIPTKNDQLIIDRMTTIWTNFAKYGDPTPETTDLLPVKWLPVTKEALNYLDINKKLTTGSRPFHQRLSFWDTFLNLNKKNVKGYQEEL